MLITANLASAMPPLFLLLALDCLSPVQTRLCQGLLSLDQLQPHGSNSPQWELTAGRILEPNHLGSSGVWACFVPDFCQKLSIQILAAYSVSIWVCLETRCPKIWRWIIKSANPPHFHHFQTPICTINRLKSQLLRGTLQMLYFFSVERPLHAWFPRPPAIRANRFGYGWVMAAMADQTTSSWPLIHWAGNPERCYCALGLSTRNWVPIPMAWHHLSAFPH